MKLLCTGDIHLGRRSSRAPEGLDGPHLSSGAAWLRLVHLALDLAVDLVLVSGDLVDQDNRYFEAYGPLEQGLRLLSAEGIEVYAVAGNHDAELLRHFSSGAGFEGFHLLGRGGRWQKAVVNRPGQAPLQLAGWSFPGERFSGNPLAGLAELDLDPGLPAVGLLHTDLDQPGSPYAPTNSEELKRTYPRLWVLGHVHKPFQVDLTPGPVLLNPGSLQALDPGETGLHGPWLVDISPGRPPELDHIPLSTARYEQIEVNLDGESDPEAVLTQAAQAVRDQAEIAAKDGGPLALLSCRLKFTGSTALHGRLEELTAAIPNDLEIRINGLTSVVERVLCETRPAVDLEDLSRSGGPPAQLARLLLAVDRDNLTPEQLRLVQTVHERLNNLHHAPPFQPLVGDPGPTMAQARDLVRRQGWSLLEALLRQKEDS